MHVSRRRVGMLIRNSYEFLKKASTPRSKNETPSGDAIVGRGLCLENGWGVKRILRKQ